VAATVLKKETERSMRVGIIAIQHESNTFLATVTGIELFNRAGLLSGQAMHDAYASSHHEVTGMLQELARHGVTAVPILSARATPSGTVTAKAYEVILERLKASLAEALAQGLDGLLVAPHGAGACASHLDMDGYWLSVVREMVGPDMPMICTLDLHANLSPAMVKACDATIAYRTNPHLDQHACGTKAADLMVRTLRGHAKPVQRGAFPRVAINIERQLTDVGPSKLLYQHADEQLTKPGVLANSVLLGFPYADVPEMGTAVVVTTDNDPVLAQQLADELASYIVSHRADFVGHFTSPSEAVSQAMAAHGPVCLLDMGDNVGGGSSADGTVLAHELTLQGALPAVVCLYDPMAQKLAREAGVGASVELSMGAKTDALHGEALVSRCTVLSLHEGKCTESQTRHGGMTKFDMGLTAVVRTEQGLTVVLNSNRTPPFSLSQITSCDLDPKAFRVLVAKGVHAPVAAYREVCPTLIRVNTPGVTCADMRQLTYAHRRKPLFPFEEI
jgi:microcystin degradation protein MlrC